MSTKTTHLLLWRVSFWIFWIHFEKIKDKTSKSLQNLRYAQRTRRECKKNKKRTGKSKSKRSKYFLTFYVLSTDVCFALATHFNTRSSHANIFIFLSLVFFFSSLGFLRFFFDHTTNDYRKLIRPNSFKIEVLTYFIQSQITKGAPVMSPLEIWDNWGIIVQLQPADPIILKKDCSFFAPENVRTKKSQEMQKRW